MCVGMVWCGETRRRARAHDVHVNGSPKSGLEPCWDVSSFCSLFLLHVQYIFEMETDSVAGHLNCSGFSLEIHKDVTAETNHSNTI